MACKPCVDARGLSGSVLDKRVKLERMNEIPRRKRRKLRRPVMPAITASQPAKAVTAQRLPMYATLLCCDAVTPSAQ